jgi:8-oxo-dGTP pyrophosphatase MutT (NUDIX family)
LTKPKAICSASVRVLTMGFVLLLSACSQTPPCVIAPLAADGSDGNAACIVDNGVALLLVRHRLGGAWGLPGGRRQEGEASQCTAHRETWEEARVLVEVGRLAARTERTHLYRCRISGDANEAAQPLLSRFEIIESAWIEKGKVAELDWRFENQRAVVSAILRAEAGRELP